MDNTRKEYTFLWIIENYSCLWHKTGEKLISPVFKTDDLPGTAWIIQIYPRGLKDEHKDNISLFLYRIKEDAGPENISLKYEFSILAADETSLCSSECNYNFKMGKGYGFYEVLKVDELFSRKADYLPQDTLTVQCKLWRGEGNKQPVIKISARTRIGIEHVFFHHIIESFSTIKQYEKKTIIIRSSKKRLALSSSFYISNDSSCGGKISVEITPSGYNQILSKCKISLLDASGKKSECGQIDNCFDFTGEEIRNVPLPLTRQEVLNRKSEYLPDDRLTLSVECSFSSRVDYEKIESTQHEKPFVTLNQFDYNDKDIYAEKLSNCPSALDDFKSSYNDHLFTDVELKTKAKSFPAHKIVICSRSSVFKVMMTSDMKEKNSNIIQVDDLEDDVVQQLLLFLYTDQIETLRWESAVKLYYAGDKYAIERLKLVCSSFLVENINTSNASELLLLADTHSDSFMKKVVEDFILENEEEVFRSNEWKNLAEENPRLVNKTMLMKYK